MALNPEDPSQQTVGRLRYMGGLVLRSEDARFGGISGLRWDFGHNHLIAITDQGDFMSLKTRESGKRLLGIGAVQIRRLSGQDGAPISGKDEADAEALEFGFNNTLLIAFERDHRIWQYDRDDAGWPGTPRDAGYPSPAWRGGLTDNGGIEAIAMAPMDMGLAWFLFGEDMRQDADTVPFLVRFSHPLPIETPRTARLPEPFKPTDAAGDGRRGGILLLSRSFSQLQGVGARLDSVQLDNIGAASSTHIATLRPPLTVDNMEGLAVRVVAGRTFLYIVSDDNFSPLQRTLLMKFELMPE